MVVDTSDLNVHELRDRLRELFEDDDATESAVRTSIVSFGYKHGLPVDVDLVFDCRFLPNPHWVDELRPLPGTDPLVREYVMRTPEATAFLDEPIPQKGDFVDHRQFGLCRVEGEDEDGGLRIRLPSGVRKVIRLDFLEVLPPRHEGDRKVFPLRPRKR